MVPDAGVPAGKDTHSLSSWSSIVLEETDHKDIKLQTVMGTVKKINRVVK